MAGVRGVEPRCSGSDPKHVASTRLPSVSPSCLSSGCRSRSMRPMEHGHDSIRHVHRRAPVLPGFSNDTLLRAASAPHCPGLPETDRPQAIEGLLDLSPKQKRRKRDSNPAVALDGCSCRASAEESNPQPVAPFCLLNYFATVAGRDGHAKLKLPGRLQTRTGPAVRIGAPPCTRGARTVLYASCAEGPAISVPGEIEEAPRFREAHSAT